MICPHPTQPRRRQVGTPHTPLTLAWAHVWPLAKARALGRSRQTSTKTASWKKQRTMYLELCSFTCVMHFLKNFANMAFPAEMAITTRTASGFRAKRRAAQPPTVFLELISWVTTGITERWPEFQPKEPWPGFVHYLATTC